MSAGKKFLTGAAIVAVVGVIGAAVNQPPKNTNLTATPPTTTTTAPESAQTTPDITSESTSPSSSDNLSNDSTYVNSDGNTVHSPAYSEDDSVPAGATARCSDGTYSFSQHARGTCSYHGGVSQWLY